jgi:site-specific recombinase XerD
MPEGKSSKTAAQDAIPPTRQVRGATVYQVRPAKAVREYLDQRANELGRNTWNSYRSKLNFFDRWCGLNSVEYVAEINARKLQAWKNWRLTEGNEVEDGKLDSSAHEESQRAVKRFLKWCEEMSYVAPGTSSIVQIPKQSDSDTRSDTDALHPAQAALALDFASKRYYARAQHVALLLLVATGESLKSIWALNRSDYERSGQTGTLRIKSGPEQEDSTSERIRLGQDVCKVLDDYLKEHWSPPTEDSGQRPLLVAKGGNGRISKATIRKYIYKLTRPCKTENTCPAGIDPSECPAVDCISAHYKCKENASPKDIKKGYEKFHREQQSAVREQESGGSEDSEEELRGQDSPPRYGLD